jgi:cell division protein FtsW
MFVWLVMRCFAIAKEAIVNERFFSALLAQGIAVWIAVQAMINIGVNMALLPTKGLTLPFLSFGGSGILTNCIAIGVLLRIDWENRRLSKGIST